MTEELKLYKWNPIEDRQIVTRIDSNRAFDWPLRSKAPRTITFSTNTDWMSDYYPDRWQSLFLATMSLATWHTFITVTHEYRNLVSMLGQMDTLEKRTTHVPGDKAFLKAILRANLKKDKLLLNGSRLQIFANKSMAKNPPRFEPTPHQIRCELPWIPRNVIFGFQVDTRADADLVTTIAYNMRKQWRNDILLAVYQPKGAEEIDWMKVTNAGMFDCIWTCDVDSLPDMTGRLV